MKSFHVTYINFDRPNEERKRLLEYDGNVTIEVAIKNLFQIDLLKRCAVQVFNKDFEDWVELDHSDEIPDKSRLKILVYTGENVVFLNEFHKK